MTIFGAVTAGYSRYRAIRNRFLFSFVPYLVSLPRRCVRPVALFCVGFTRTIRHGLRNSVRDQSTSIRLGHKVINNPGDLARFAVKLANRCGIGDLQQDTSLDVILLADSEADISGYVLVPYLRARFFNIHAVYDAAELDALLATLGGADAVAGLRSDLSQSGDPVPLDSKAIGPPRLPAFFMNEAREFMKSHDWSARYCAISPVSGTFLAGWIKALCQLAETYPNWRFLPLGLNAFVTERSVLPSNIVVPGRAGIGFLTQLAIAMQADAFLGVADVYGICSTLTGVPTTLLAEDTRPAAVALLEECPHVRRALAHAPLADELAMLLDRADATVDNASAPATGEFVSA